MWSQPTLPRKAEREEHIPTKEQNFFFFVTVIVISVVLTHFLDDEYFMGYFIIQLVLPAGEILVRTTKSFPQECLNGGFSAKWTHVHTCTVADSNFGGMQVFGCC